MKDKQDVDWVGELADWGKDKQDVDGVDGLGDCVKDKQDVDGVDGLGDWVKDNQDVDRVRGLGDWMKDQQDVAWVDGLSDCVKDKQVSIGRVYLELLVVDTVNEWIHRGVDVAKPQDEQVQVVRGRNLLQCIEKYKIYIETFQKE